jgi:ATP-dependent HslUV protease ATP-binding subunit HslU
MNKFLTLTPKNIVDELDNYIIGQKNAKKVVAIALRNSWRRNLIKHSIKNDIIPKNVILIGSTGTGKTEIARQLAKVTSSPFIKVEATKFTEVGYVGKDVDSIITDLVSISVKNTLDKTVKSHMNFAKKISKNYVINLLIPDSCDKEMSRKKLKKMLEEGFLSDQFVSINVPKNISNDIIKEKNDNFISGKMQEVLQSSFNNLEKPMFKRMLVKDAIDIVSKYEAYKMVNKDDIIANAIEDVEKNGIVFLDEIDKIASSNKSSNIDISRSGVQRDILPIVEGSIDKTNYGEVNTKNIFFIAAGAFHTSSLSDLMPELQGRFPIHATLDELNQEDLFQILCQPKNSLIKQYQSLLAVDNMILNFKKSGVEEISKFAFVLNTERENIGARRLYSILENLLEVENFNDDVNSNDLRIINIDKEYVSKNLYKLINSNIYKNIL